jgi:hypothetical protein
MAVRTRADYICVQREEDGSLVLATADWPPTTLIDHALIGDAEHRIVLRYPYLIIRLDNARAVYRVTTCEHGVWTGTLVESHKQ